MTRRSILTVVAAVLGLAVSAALAWSASQLAGQRIGLASEPLAVTQGLAPHRRAAASPKPAHAGHKNVSAKPAPPPAATTSSPQIFTTSTAAPLPVTPAPAAPTTAAPPAAVTTTAASSSGALGSQSSSGASRRRDDHHPDD